jgi:hypothetical protein
LSITAGQAATGNYDARLIEVQGVLTGMHVEPDSKMLVLELASGAQAFRAFIPAGQSAQFYRRLTPRSLLNLRGVCTLDRRYTQGVTSFALLLRSTEDIDRLAGPPWWTPLRPGGDRQRARLCRSASIVSGGNVRIVRKGRRRDGRSAPAHIPVRVADALFHIGREAIVNSVRHADPRQIALSIEYDAKSVILTVEDEGRGFDAEQQTHGQQTRGFGLRGMEKRARSIGAHLVVTSQPDVGTRVRVAAPLEAHQSARGLFGTVWSRLRKKLSRWHGGLGGRIGWAREPAVRRGGSRLS